MFKINKIACILALVCFSFIQNANAQRWVTMMNDPQYTLKQVQDEFNAYWEHRTITKGSGYKPFKRWEYMMRSRLDQNGKIISTNYIQQQQKQYIATRQRSVTASAANWTSVGPNSGVGIEGGAGRIQCFAMDPNATNNYWAGTPSGGLWKSTDAGANWINKSDANLPSAMGVSSILINPSNSNIIFVATGDADHGDTQCTGILKSTDGGNTWSTTGLTFALTDYKRIYKMSFLPGNPNVMFALSSDGIYRSNNAGTNWTLVKSILPAYDIEFHPTTPNTMYATGGGKLLKSTDGGLTWVELTSGIPLNNNRCLIAVTAAAPDNVYFLSAENDPNLAVYISTNKGVSFTSLTTNLNVGAQTWYDLVFDVNPTNASRMYVGGVVLNQSDDGGTSWYYTGGNIHADEHNMYCFGNTLFVCNDGGLFRSSDNGVSWSLLHNGMDITQFYRISSSPYESNYIVGGSQDNGTFRFRNNAWKQINGGDGMDNAISAKNSEVVWSSTQNGPLFKSTDGGNTSNYVNGNITETGSWVTPLELNPNNHDSVIAGFENVWTSNVGGGTWNKISDLATTFPNVGGYIDKIILNWNNPNIIYIAKGGNLLKTINAGATWTDLTPNLESGVNIFGTMVLDPKNSNRIWMANNSGTPGKKVYYSSNGGLTFTNVSGTLPDVPMFCMVYVPGSNDGIYLGTETGVFYKDASMNDWVLYNTGLPTVRVQDIDLNLASGKIRAGTYGRGIWESPMYNETAGKPIADFETSTKAGCQGTTINFRDFSFKATSWSWSFPGGTPSTSTLQNPVISYNTNGSFAVTLTVTNSNGSSTKSKSGMVNISGQLVSAFPYQVNFDNLVTGDTITLGGWTNGTDDNSNWFVHTGIAPIRTGEPPLLAGPTADHTTGTGKYLLYESSVGSGLWANLYSPCFNLGSVANPVLEYYEHVYGIDSEGELHLDILSDGVWHLDIIPLENLIGNQWFKKTVDLTAYANKIIRIRFRALSSYTRFDAKDFALDDIKISTKQNVAPIADLTANITSGFIGFTSKFYDQSSNFPTSYNWSFPGGTPSTSTLANPEITYNTAGTHNVSLTATNAYGTNTITKTAYIYANGAIYNMSNRTVTDCIGRLYDSGGEGGTYGDNEQLIFTIAPAGAQQVKLLDFLNWDMAAGDLLYIYDGTSINAPLISSIGTMWGGARPASISANSGAITLQFISNSAGNARGFGIEWQTIGGTCSPGTTVQPPIADFTSPTVNGPAYFQSTLDATQNTALGWTWLLPGSDNVRQYGKNISVSYSNPGVYDVTLIEVNEGGRDTITKAAFFTVTAPPVEVNMKNGTETSCTGNLYDDGGPFANYTDSKTYTLLIQPSGATSVTMNFSEWAAENSYDFLKIYNGTTTSAPLLGSWSGTSPGIVTANSGAMTLKFTSDGGVNAAGWKAAWTSIGGTCSPAVIPVTDFNASSTTVNVGSSVTFTDLSTNTPTSWSWSFAGGTPATSTVKNPVITYSTAGIYSVTLTSTNAAGSNAKTKTAYITVNALPAPVADFSASATNINTGAAVTFTDLSTNTPASWSWSFQGGTPASSTVKNPVITYSTAGIYSVTLTATNAGGSNMITKTGYITVTTAPLAINMKNGTEISCTGTLYDDGGPNANYTNSKTYTLLIQPSGATSISMNFSSWAAENNYDFLKIYNGTSTSAPLLGSWSGTSPGTVTANSGAMTLKFTSDGGVNASGWKSTWTSLGGTCSPVTIPVADFNASVTTVNAGASVTFTDLSTNTPTSWSWSFTGGTPATSTVKNPVITYSTAGTYAVTLIATNAGGSNTKTKTAYITVNALPAPVANFSASATTVNVGSSVTFTDLSTNTPTSWSWSFTGGTPSTSTVKNPVITYSTAGTYAVTLTATNAGGSNTITKTAYITVNALPAPVADFSASATTVNVGSSITFTDLSANTPTSWSWSFTGGTPSTSTVKNPVITYSTMGTYAVGLTATNAGGSNAITKTAYITVNSAGLSINMKNGTETSCTGTLYDDGGPSANYTDSKTYTLLIQPSGATSITMNFSQWAAENNYDFLKIYNGTTTSAPLLGSWSGTSPGTVTANSGAMTLKFTSDAGVNAAGWKSTWTSIGGTCSPAVVPVAEFSASATSVNAGASATFTDLSTNTPTSWSWNFQGGTPSTSTLKNPVITYSTVGTYPVTLTATNTAGSNTMTKTSYITVTAAAITINMKNGTETSCTGTLYDDGGPSANYTDSKTYTLLIQPSLATSVTMNFSQWAAENTYDIMKIYNGTTTSAPLLGTWSGTSPGTVTANSGAMTLKFTSDASVNAAGWKATWTSTGAACVASARISDNESGDSNEKQDASLISIYPNPTIGLFTLLMNKKYDQLIIYNINGTIVRKLLVQSKQIEIDLGGETPGVYVLKLIGQDEVKTVRIILK